MTTLPAGLVPATYQIDPSHSQASFSVRHAGISRVRGSVPITSGSVVVGEDLASSSVTAELDAANITTGDKGRDDHLRSADFFSVETNPTWTFTSSSLTGDGEDFTLSGELTINGVSKPVELALEYTGSATDPFGQPRAAFEANTEISRKEWGITWNAALEAGGVLVGDKVKISLDISAIKA